jgi:cation diffusion facilitator CzcD-associated flavoprotein CzcO
VVETQLLVIGAGPYGLSTAAWAEANGIDSLVVGRPMSFWREHMPERMLLRSGVDWHLDAAGVHTFEAFAEERAIAEDDLDPIPIHVFLDYCDWFQDAKRIPVRDVRVERLARSDGRFEVALEDGDEIVADAVVCAPGIRHYTNVPAWASALPDGLGTHTCDLVRFDDFAGARVLIVGGRQSAYEWAALIGEQGAERIDVVHRHDVPRFERVSWKFADPHVERTIEIPGYWRNLPPAEREQIARRFWEVGRLTLEYWLPPRLDEKKVRSRPGTEVVEVAVSPSGEEVEVLLSDSERLTVDRVVFASGYKADLSRVPYLAGLVEDVELADGFPVLDETFGTSVAGLYVTGFSATRDFGPFFGFVKGVPAAATLTVRGLLALN